VETLQAHKVEVAAYFRDRAVGSSSIFPAWQALGCYAIVSAGGNPGSFGPVGTFCELAPDDLDLSTVRYDDPDNPPLHPCLNPPAWLIPPALPGQLPGSMSPSNFSGIQCDLHFTPTNLLNPNTNSYLAFGRVGYYFTVTAYVTKTPSSQLVVNNIMLDRYAYDTYQWNPVVATLDHILSNIQAGADAADRAGHIFQVAVPISKPSLAGFTYTFQ
jgi:hypothetical protein